MNNGGACKLS